MLEKLKFLTSGMWSFLQPFIRVFMSDFGPILASSAMSAVRAVAENMQGVSGADKRDAAFNIIVDDLKRQSIRIGADVSSSAIHAAIEVAVQRLKG